ncbi:hypothetical protein WG628_08950 [Stenotrophomonas maltophilia]
MSIAIARPTDEVADIEEPAISALALMLTLTPLSRPEIVESRTTRRPVLLTESATVSEVTVLFLISALPVPILTVSWMLAPSELSFPEPTLMLNASAHGIRVKVESAP